MTLCLLQGADLPPTWLQTLQAALTTRRILLGLSQLPTAGFVARVLADDDEAMTQLARWLWHRIRTDLWGKRWHPWRKM
jgi:urease accessory protein UreH